MKVIFPKIHLVSMKKMYELDGAVENKYGYNTPVPAFYDRKYNICVRNDLPIFLLWECILHETMHWLIESFIIFTRIKVKSIHYYQWKFEHFCDKYIWWCDFLYKKYA